MSIGPCIASYLGTLVMSSTVSPMSTDQLHESPSFKVLYLVYSVLDVGTRSRSIDTIEGKKRLISINIDVHQPANSIQSFCH